MYGWRGRIGLLIPSSNTTMESEFWKVVPDGVSIHTARMRLIEASAEALKEMAKEALKAAEDLATANVNLILYGCTTGSLIEGIRWEQELSESIRLRTGVKAITTAFAVIEALKALSIKNVAVATPYIEELNEKEKVFLEECGFKVVRMKGLNILKNTEIGMQPSWVSYKLARDVYTHDVDGIFISCTNFRTLDILEKLESDLNKPVVSSNSASIWLALKELGVREQIKGYGKLLANL
ncbi:MAG: aspartate/glutamate racemase family protein [Nitrososphaerota archaeon]|nr:aspartate/glutamate racemase family protein [Nitrososphaerales archaeon]MDW8044456.1 aspartate/glutamate racemase family protein [Nitrososphaerota archaeon]